MRKQEVSELRNCARNFDRIKDICMGISDEETWAFKSVDYILRRHTAYDKGKDAIVLVFTRYGTVTSYSIPMDDLREPYRAKRAMAKLSAKHFGTENVVDAVRQAFLAIMTGGHGIRVIDKAPAPLVDRRWR